MIHRDVDQAIRRDWDLIVVGGGVYGCMLTLQASRRGLRVVLLERNDFGGGTSWNSLRILHGGLRYLQHLDLSRFRESVAERRWFLRTFPDLVRPLPCVMPLYGRGLKRPSVLRMVLAANDLLSARRNHGVPPGGRLPSSRVLTPQETAALAPEACEVPVRGGALWYDGVMLAPQRVLVDALKWAGQGECVALNYLQVRSLLRGDGRVTGVQALDMASGRELEIRAAVVVNAAGPGCRVLAETLDGKRPHLFHPSLAFNLLLEGKLRNDVALATYADARDSQTFFLYPFHGRILAGTFHEPVHGHETDARPRPGPDALERAVEALNAALPGLRLAVSDVVHVLPGYLPVLESGTTRLTHRPVVVDHGSTGGPRGLWSVSGVKFTTARAVADRILDRIERSGAFARGLGTPDKAPPAPDRKPSLGTSPLDPDELLGADSSRCGRILERMVREEAVLYLDDLVLRRLDGLRIIDRADEVGESLGRRLGWSPRRIEEGVDRLRRSVGPSPA